MQAATEQALRRVNAVRYVLPLREGGSLPALVEADDLGTYVMKFRGAGQGPKALVAEVVVGELGRRLGLPVPELVVAVLDPDLAPAEPDQEVQDLLRASVGDNLGMDYLPGSLGLDVAVDRIDPDLAARVVWFDALVQNVDRSWRNPNLLMWHRDLWLIDHGATLTFHHAWERAAGWATKPYDVTAHVLGDAEPRVRPSLTALVQAVADIPDVWLVDEPGFASADEVRAAYVRVLSDRLAAREVWQP